MFVIFLIFAQNIVDTRYNRLDEAVLRDTNNLCFGAKIRKIGIPLHTPVLLYKVGFMWVYISRVCFPDDEYFMIVWMTNRIILRPVSPLKRLHNQTNPWSPNGMCSNTGINYSRDLQSNDELY